MDSASAFAEEYKLAGEDCLKAAHRYLRLGWPALALCPPDHVGVGREHGKSCGSPGKRPWHNWTEYQERLPTEKEVNEWWRVGCNSNVGVAMGPVCGLVGVDPDGPAGEAKLQEMSGGDLPDTLEFSTPGGGRRLLYAIPEGANFRPTYVALGKKEELRFLAHGAQTVMPPSRHVSGGRYAWKPGHGPDERDAAPAPEWLVTHLSPSNRQPTATKTGLVEGELIEEGRRNALLTSLAGTMRSRGFSAVAIAAALLAENGERCDPPLAEFEVNSITASVARYAPGRPEIQYTRGGTPDVGFSLGLTSMTDLRPQPLRWLVPGYLPLGKLVLLAGNGGHGKSTVTLHIAAALSLGRRPFGLHVDRTEPCSTLLVSCEDDYEDTILPRLMSAGADLSRIFRVDGIKDKDGKMTPFSLAHYEAIEAELKNRPDVKLIVVDPAGAFVGRSGIDDHKDSELRALLGPLTELAARQGVTILIVKHLSKGTTARAVDKVGGSTGYVNAVRAAFLIAPDPDDDSRKFLMPIKFNLGAKPGAIAYRLSSLGLEEQAPIIGSCDHLGDEDKTRLAAQLFRVDWLGIVDADADTVMSSNGSGNHKEEKKSGKQEEAADWLLDFLSAGPKPSEEIMVAGKTAGISRERLFGAKKHLNGAVAARKKGYGAGKWEWELTNPAPAPDASDASDSSDPSDGTDGMSVPFRRKRPVPSEASSQSEASDETEI